MLRTRLADALKDAMKAKDARRTSTVRMILAKLKDQDIAARTEASREGIAEADILRMLQGMVKQRRESVALYEQGGRADLAQQERDEITVIEEFLPSQMSDADLEAAVAAAIAEVGATGIKDMGKVVGVLKGKYAGQMDMAKAAAAVKARLGA